MSFCNAKSAISTIKQICNIRSDRFCSPRKRPRGRYIFYASIQYHVFGRYVCAVIDNKHNFFRGLPCHSVNLILGNLPEIRPYHRNSHGSLFMVPVLVRNILNALYIYFLVFSASYRCPLSDRGLYIRCNTHTGRRNNQAESPFR